MYCKVTSGSFLGVQGVGIGVEVDVSAGLPMFEMVGFLGSEVKEARERVRTALKNSGFAFPAKRITINLSPANIKKTGTAFDLPIALAVLCAIGILPKEQLDDCIVLGELGLDGEVRSVKGVLPILSYAKKVGISHAIVPKANAMEAAVVKDISIHVVDSILDAVNLLLQWQTNGARDVGIEVSLEKMLENETVNCTDFSDIAGQVFVKRGLEIAASGLHNILMVGPPGAGKSMLAKCMPSILPPLTLDESIEITKIYSVKGLLQEHQALIGTRPFRSPHHTISKTALTGGGQNPTPGEISLAHNGVLFLDELPEFNREAIEVMRQPLEDRNVTISRVGCAYQFPADFMLVAAMNPCPCGYFPDREKCRCTPTQITKYLSKVSQPMLDRIDLCVETKAVSYEQLRSKKKEESSAMIRSRVEQAQRIQKQRYKEESIYFNSQLSVKQLDKYCALESEEELLMKDAMEQYHMSARAYHRILRVARTIADLDGKESIETAHLLEAIMYHNGGTKYWNHEVGVE